MRYYGALKCETCGATESNITAGKDEYSNLAIFNCGAILMGLSNGQWSKFAPCPIPLIRALHAVGGCGNTCIVCKQEIESALESVSRKAATK